MIVNVSVKDKSGKAIEDLKKDQFTLLEDGKPQQIAVFELQHLNGETLPAHRSAGPDAEDSRARGDQTDSYAGSRQ